MRHPRRRPPCTVAASSRAEARVLRRFSPPTFHPHSHTTQLDFCLRFLPIEPFDFVSNATPTVHCTPLTPRPFTFTHRSAAAALYFPTTRRLQQRTTATAQAIPCFGLAQRCDQQENMLPAHPGPWQTCPCFHLPRLFTDLPAYFLSFLSRSTCAQKELSRLPRLLKPSVC